MNLHSAIPVLTVMNFHHVLLGQIGTWSMNKVFLFRKPNNGKKDRGLAVLVNLVRCHDLVGCGRSRILRDGDVKSRTERGFSCDLWVRECVLGGCVANCLRHHFLFLI